MTYFTYMRRLPGFLLLLAVSPVGAQEVGWRANGGDVLGTCWSPAAVIPRENVARLEVARTYRTGEPNPLRSR